MYVEQSGLSTGLGAVNSALDLGMQSMNAYDGLMKEKAKSDMFYAQAQLNANTQEFLRDLEQRNDYENYETYAKQFLTKQKNALQKNIKNNYTAELYSQLFTTAENSLNNTIQTARMQKEYEAIGTQNASAIALNNNTLSGQNAIDANNSIINSEYANGMRNSGYTRAAHLKNASESIAKEWTTAADAKIQNIINNGGDFSEVEKLIDDMALNNEYKVMMLSDKYASPEGMRYANEETGEGYINIGNEIDKKQIAKELKSTLKTKYNAMVNEMQEKNMGTITEWEVDMFRLSPSEQITFATNALMKLDRDFGGNKLSPSQRNQAANMFKAVKSGKAASGKTEDKLKVFKPLMKDKMESFINLVKDGTFSGYEAKIAFEEEALEEYREVMEKPDATLFDLNKDVPIVYGFIEELKKDAPEKYKAAITSLEDVTKKLLKDNKVTDTSIIQKITDVAWDFYLGTNLNDDEAQEAFLQRMDKEINGLFGAKLDKYRENPLTGKLKIAAGVTGTDGTLYDLLKEAKNHPDWVYTDESTLHGEDKTAVTKESVFAGPGAKGLRRSEELQRQFITDNLKEVYGIEIDPKSLKMGYAQEGAYDVSAEMIFADSNGTQYKLEPGEDKQIHILRKPFNGKWEEVNTKKGVESAEKKNEKAEARKAVIESEEHKNEIMKEMSLIVSKITPVYNDVPPGMEKSKWYALINRKGDKNKNIATALKDLMLSLERHGDEKAVNELREWLNKFTD